ncbi:hypothetical protein CY34DRAFT_16493 [Suillus luteus UH-Slu-Lm8-n1]|uniref:Uncharacterized protein n=1 Tax=Suillus luteus UH-Slu-Lm8-n1 TaxID=930992 RepID=A0A0D0ADR7_9AGAM|nr:hypothetical protein CY34DRAFT_16493 [Suillus luteus UH-Slu-Lm8-n1]
MDLSANFIWTPPLASQSQVDDELEGLESIIKKEVAAAFDEIKQHIIAFPLAIDPQLKCSPTGAKSPGLPIPIDNNCNFDRYARI